MTSRPPHHPLRDQRAAADPGPPVDWLTGVVVEHDTTAVPHTVRVRLAEGTDTDPLTYLGWWSPTVDDVVHLLRKGPALLVLGPEAPTNPAPIPPARVIPPTPPAAPAAAPTTRTVFVAPVGFGSRSVFGWRDELVQGGPAGSRAVWLYGDRVEQARAGGTIVAGTVYVQRVPGNRGAPGPAVVRLGVHPHETRPANLGPLTAVAGRTTLLPGGDALVHLTAEQVSELNAGAAGVGLEPGSLALSSPEYLQVVTGGASGQLALTVVE